MIGEYNNLRGTSLLELLVVLGIFSLLVGSLIAVFVGSVSVERKSLATQSVLDNTRYTIELMSRAIRQADPDTLTALPPNCDTNPPCTELGFEHGDPLKGSMLYRFDSVNGKILEQSGTTGGSPVSITASNVNVQSLAFQIFGGGVSDQQQPRVVIALTISAASGTTPAMDIETAVSLRSPQE